MTNLTSRVYAYGGDHTLTESINAIKDLLDYERSGVNIDRILVELQSGAVPKVDRLLQEGKLNLGEVGHICLFLGYSSKKEGASVGIFSIEDYATLMKGIKKDMLLKDQSNLYQLCSRKNEPRIRRVLEDEGFELV